MKQGELVLVNKESKNLERQMKSGDLVKGKQGTYRQYLVTNDNCIAKVLKIQKDGKRMDIIVEDHLTNKKVIGKEYNVKLKDFETYKKIDKVEQPLLVLGPKAKASLKHSIENIKSKGFPFLKLELEANTYHNSVSRECDECGGNGYVEEDCDDCNGNGFFDVCTIHTNNSIECVEECAKTLKEISCNKCRAGLIREDCEYCDNGTNGGNSLEAMEEAWLQALDINNIKRPIFAKYYYDGSVDTEVTFTIPIEQAYDVPNMILLFKQVGEELGGGFSARNAGMHTTVMMDSLYPSAKKMNENKLNNFISNVTPLLGALLLKSTPKDLTRGSIFRELRIDNNIKYSAIYTKQKQVFEYRIFDTCYSNPLYFVDYLDTISRTVAFYDTASNIRKATHNMQPSKMFKNRVNYGKFGFENGKKKRLYKIIPKEEMGNIKKAMGYLDSAPTKIINLKFWNRQKEYMKNIRKVHIEAVKKDKYITETTKRYSDNTIRIWNEVTKTNSYSIGLGSKIRNYRLMKEPERGVRIDTQWLPVEWDKDIAKRMRDLGINADLMARLHQNEKRGKIDKNIRIILNIHKEMVLIYQREDTKLFRYNTYTSKTLQEREKAIEIDCNFNVIKEVDYEKVFTTIDKHNNKIQEAQRLKENKRIEEIRARDREIAALQEHTAEQMSQLQQQPPMASQWSYTTTPGSVQHISVTNSPFYEVRS